MLHDVLVKPYDLEMLDPGDPRPDVQLVLKLLKLIDEHFQVEKTRYFYCNSLRVSLAKLNDLCKEYLGKTLYQVMVDRVLAEAVKLLRGTELSVKEITFKLGFSDQAYFGRCVKKSTGLTPQQVRMALAL